MRLSRRHLVGHVSKPQFLRIRLATSSQLAIRPQILMHLDDQTPGSVKIANHLASGARHFSFMRPREVHIAAEEGRRQESLFNQRWVLTVIE